MKPAESSPAPAPAPSDDRGGLLDAIRKAGGKEGAGLKSIKERKAEERKRRQGEEEAVPKSSGGGGGGERPYGRLDHLCCFHHVIRNIHFLPNPVM